MVYDYKPYYRRKLPHRHSPGSTLFITYRLHGSIPRSVVDRWKADAKLLELERKRVTDRVLIQHLEAEFRRRWFGQFEDALHEQKGPLWLKKPSVAKLVADSLHNLNGVAYSLHAFCVMANHVHTLFTPFLDERSLIEVKDGDDLRLKSDDPTLSVIMKSLKGFTAREENKILGRRGRFWDAESYDHEVRNGSEFGRIKNYILNNPVKAGLVKDWRDWKWSWRETEGETKG